MKNKIVRSSIKKDVKEVRKTKNEDLLVIIKKGEEQGIMKEIEEKVEDIAIEERK